MKLSRSTYYYQVKRLTQGDNNKELKEAIQDIYSENKGRYGYRRIHLELKNRGYKVNHKKVQRLMTELGLKARIRAKRRYNSYKGEVARKLIISLSVNLKLPNHLRSVIPMSQSFQFLLVIKNCIYHQFLMALTVRLLHIIYLLRQTYNNLKRCFPRLFLNKLTRALFYIVTKDGNINTLTTIIFLRSME
ncbi:transposase IS861 orfB [Streptococcus dysgalactiae subsp. dysgalactiae ATCC 27957]|nr:transposase IS861 orfB [Streptococcus dysgalactiae subsp. dysgalactiae ATCC 27957]